MGTGGAGPQVPERLRLDRFDRFDTLPSGVVKVTPRAGMADVARESFPRWKAMTGLDWSRGQWSANWSTRYIGATDEGPAPAYGNIPAQLTHDAWGAYSTATGLATFTLGVQNLFDKDPPLSYVNGGDLNFDMSTYNPRLHEGHLQLLLTQSRAGRRPRDRFVRSARVGGEGSAWPDPPAMIQLSVGNAPGRSLRGIRNRPWAPLSFADCGKDCWSSW